MPTVATGARLCRMDPATLLAPQGSTQTHAHVTAGSLLTLMGGTLLYGFAFGLWRAPEQGIYSAIKLPILFLTIVLTTTLINSMLAVLMGIPLGIRKTFKAMLYAMAVTASILGAFAPIAVFLVLQLPAPLPAALGQVASHPAVQASMAIFWPLLLGHIAMIAIAGTIGCLRLHAVLKMAAPTPRGAARLLAAWMLVTGFVGGELSWLLSPYLCKPDFSPHVIARTFHEGNFYEQLYRAVRSL
jgi:hypothetical protein